MMGIPYPSAAVPARPWLTRHLSRWPVRIGVAGALMLVTTSAVWALTAGELQLVRTLHPSQIEHVDQAELKQMVADGQDEEAFEVAFEIGDALFADTFTAVDGVGANVGQNQRFTRIPRADLVGPGEWANHTPSRTTGPNAQSCSACHGQPFEDGAGPAAGNVHRDPGHTGNLRLMIQRNAPHAFAPGALQRLAEEMTDRLASISQDARNDACQSGLPTTKQLIAKGVDFGSITAQRVGTTNPCVTQLITTDVRGVDADLVVRPFQWKGSVPFLRDFNRGAMHNELGMQPVETAGHDVDGDGDGVANEMGIGDMTALAVYLAAQPRPTTRVELADLADRGLLPPLDPPMTTAERAAIGRGSQRFRSASLGCAACHVPRMTLNDPIFSEPSQNPRYRDAVFPAGQSPIAEGLDPAFPITFDLTRDQPDNQLRDSSGQVVYRLGSLRRQMTESSIWSDASVPVNPSEGDSRAVELGVKFRADVAGQVTGVRFYKGTGNTGSHVGKLYTLSGTLLASATFAGESATGWQEVSFAAPVGINANTTYVASYYAPNGHYAADQNSFATAVLNPPLRALANGTDGGNGVFRYGVGGGFPNQTFRSTNYWVDVVFATEGRINVEAFGDLRRHDMGPRLAENIDDEGVAASTFMTENLWGVASTAPYMHDGRATTLTEAILEHGMPDCPSPLPSPPSPNCRSEAQASRDAFVALSPGQKQDLLAFLNNLVLFKLPEEEE
jgi:mono/diheme cytochrome c family protein